MKDRSATSLTPTRFVVLQLFGLAALASCGETPAAKWIQDVQTAHEAVDQAEKTGELGAGRKQLDAALALEVPRDVNNKDAAHLRQDLWQRLAQLELRAQQPQDALVAAEAGLREAQGIDVLTANLWVSKGSALKALDRDEEAVRSFVKALDINEALLQEALDD